MRKIVIDASVIVKWKFTDEEETEVAQKILHDFLEQNIFLLAPTLWLYEVVNALRSATLKGKITSGQGKSWVPYFQNLGILEIGFPSLAKNALILANKYGLSVYDASYLALAVSEKIPFYTGDRKLFEKIKKIPRVFWVGNYQSPKI